MRPATRLLPRLQRTLGVALLCPLCSAVAQQAGPSDALQQQVQKLATAVASEQGQLESSQREIQALRQQVADLQAQLASHPGAAPSSDAAATALQHQVDEIREQQAAQQTEIAVQDQKKVESESKYSLRLTGLILANGYRNTGNVDIMQSPTLALPGNSASGLSLQQSIFGLDARGPHLFGAATRGDVRVDFFGDISQTGYAANSGVLRMRTAHAALDWPRTTVFFSLDRTLLSPQSPTSLTALAQPALSWSGNLWSWLPQVGASQTVPLTGTSSLKFSAGLLDVPSSPYGSTVTGTPSLTTTNASLAEQSHWPGSEFHIGYSHGDEKTGLQLGAAGYFSPHGTRAGVHYDAWAVSGDYRLPITHFFELSGSLYRGLALGALGGGNYKDAVYSFDGNDYYFERPLDDAGGWSQLKFRASQRLEFNAAYGLDNAYAHELESYSAPGESAYQSLSRNATFFTNTIYSPTSYTLFSFEYRKINSNYIAAPHATTDVYGLAAGYKF